MANQGVVDQVAIAAADWRGGKLDTRATLAMENGVLLLLRPWGGTGDDDKAGEGPPIEREWHSLHGEVIARYQVNRSRSQHHMGAG